MIKECSHVLFLISRASVNKRGFIQKELRHALEVLQEFPPEKIFIIPCRLDDTRPSHEALEKLHWVDLFVSYEKGLARIAKSLDLEIPRSEEKIDVPAMRRQRAIGPDEMPEGILDSIRKRAEEHFPNDFSTRRYQIQTEVDAWTKLQKFQPPGLPEDVLVVILDRAAANFPDDFSTRFYQAETEVNAWRKLQKIIASDIHPDDLQMIIKKAEIEFPQDFSTRLYQIDNEIAAWRDLYGQ